jgi:putative transposase
MTTATMALAELAEKGSDIDVLRQMVQFMAQRLMQMDVEGRCGAGYDEKTPERTNSRDGYREREWDTRAGSVTLKIPKLRQGRYLPEFL